MEKTMEGRNKVVNMTAMTHTIHPASTLNEKIVYIADPMTVLMKKEGKMYSSVKRIGQAILPSQFVP